MNNKNQEQAYMLWLNGTVQVMVATTAFGMGIDKPNVRFVIHYTIPRSIDAYVQESGRCGRDGIRAVCMILYKYEDKYRLQQLLMNSEVESTADTVSLRHLKESKLNDVLKYCENYMECRRAIQMQHFGEEFTSTECLQDELTACDNCLSNNRNNYVLEDNTSEAQLIIAAINQTFNGTRTAIQLVNEIVQQTSNNQFGVLKMWPRQKINRLVHHMILNDVLCENVQTKTVAHKGNQIVTTFAYIKCGPNVDKVMGGELRIKLYAEQLCHVSRLRSQLISKRQQLSEAHHQEPQYILTDAAIEIIANEAPAYIARILAIQGVNQQYAQDFCRISSNEAIIRLRTKMQAINI